MKLPIYIVNSKHKCANGGDNNGVNSNTNTSTYTNAAYSNAGAAELFQDLILKVW